MMVSLILDVGCGPGYVDRLYGDTVGVDRNLAECLSFHRLLGLPAVCADATALPFRNGAFGSVVSHQCIEHVWDERSFVSELRRVCVSGGSITISSVIRKWFGFYPYRGKDGVLGRLSWDHCREYKDKAEFLNAVRDIGPVEITEQLFYYPLFEILRNALLKVLVPILGFKRVTATQRSKI
jgi:SAM-dependent methyltransferase